MPTRPNNSPLIRHNARFFLRFATELTAFALTADRVSFAADARGGAAAAPPPVAAPAHIDAPAPAESVHVQSTDASPANRPTESHASKTAQPNPTNTIDQTTPREHHDHHRDNSTTYYPLGYAYDYWDSGWYPYNNAYAPNYPGQFIQQDGGTDQSADQSPVAQPAAALLPPPSPDSTSAALNAALEASPQWREADQQVRIAQAQYDAQSARVLAQLQTQPAYQQAVGQKALEAQKLAAIHARNPDASISRTESVATAKLDAAEAVTRMEKAAIQSDPQAAAANAKLEQAVAERAEARAAVAASLAKTPSAR